MVSLAKGTPKRFDEELVMMQKEAIIGHLWPTIKGTLAA